MGQALAGKTWGCLDDDGGCKWEWVLHRALFRFNQLEKKVGRGRGRG